MVEPHCSNFRVITANFSGVRIFRIVHGMSCFRWLYSTGSPSWSTATGARVELATSSEKILSDNWTE